MKAFPLCRRQTLSFVLALAVLIMPAAAGERDAARTTRVPRWDARGLGPLPRMGVTSLDVSDDGKEIVVGTFAAPGDPNVIVLDAAGKIVRTYMVGQRGINQVAFLPASHDVLAVCTMPAGKAGDRPEVARCQGKDVAPESVQQEGVCFFHYGDHSNHPTLLLARARNATAILAGNKLVIHRKDRPAATIRVPVNEPDASLSLAIDDAGWAVVGTTTHESTAGNNLYLFDPDRQEPVWSRPVNKDVAKALLPEKGKYGTPTLPDGTRKDLPQREEKVWAPLSVAIHSSSGKRLIAAADYQGWQRWVFSSATMKEDNQGLRFMPAKPTVTVFDETGKIVKRFPADKFKEECWCNLAFSGDGQGLHFSPHLWRSRGLGGQSVRRADDDADVCGKFDLASDAVETHSHRKLLADQAISEHGLPMVAGVFPGKGGSADGDTAGFVAAVDAGGKRSWHIDLNKADPRTPRPWVDSARATPIVPGVWQLPGGRVESDLGGQRLIEAPDGYILIEGHAGLSFDREWAAMEAVGLDPRKVKYVLATHEHGDHAPGAYLWRVVTGAQFVCSEEMAYTLQHHIPLNTGYGLHPPVPTDIVIKKDTELDLAGLKVRALRIPGHTYGSMAWHFEKSGKSFVAFGDLIMPHGVLGYSGSVNFSARDVLGSLRKLHALKVDVVLPGHGAVQGPDDYFRAGIDVGTAVGWGFVKPERPDPRFRITRKNVVVVGWGLQATSAAFGDVNGDGKPDVVIVSPHGDGSVVRFFLNHGGTFKDQPDHEIEVPSVGQPHKVRLTPGPNGPHLLVAGKSAALLTPIRETPGKIPSFKVIPFDLGDGNQLRFLDGTPLVARRFGGFFALDVDRGKATLRRFVPEIDGPYVDFRLVGNDLLTAYGQLHRRADGKFPRTPTWQAPHDKDWTFLAVGDFNGDGKPDAAFLSYGMDRATSARIMYGHSRTELAFADREDVVLPLSALLTSARTKQTFPLVRDTPAVADWNGDGIDDLIVAHGQSDEVLVLLGSKEGLSKERVQRLALEYRVHYEHGVYVGDFNGDGRPDLAVFGYTNTGVGAGGPPAVYIWLQEARP